MGAVCALRAGVHMACTSQCTCGVFAPHMLLCACVSGGTACFIGIVCVRGCGLHSPHSREQITPPPPFLNEAVQVETSQSVLFLDSGQCSANSLLFSIREVTSVAIIAGDMQAMTDVSEMAQKLMSACEGAMTAISHQLC
jgi:hypothetical protein